ncbi:MAG: hypothetical protein AAGI38_23335, partial [Bacteroidota bacterium]
MGKEQKGFRSWVSSLSGNIIVAILLLLGYGLVKYTIENLGTSKPETVLPDTTDTSGNQTVPPPSENSPSQNIVKPTPKPSTPKNLSPLFNSKYSGSIAIADLEDRNNISSVLNDCLIQNQFQSTTSFFRKAFFDKHQNLLWEQGVSIIEKISVPTNLKCVCLLKEDFDYETKERYGQDFTVGKGEVKIKLIHLGTGKVESFYVQVGGSGADKRRAYESIR